MKKVKNILPINKEAGEIEINNKIMCEKISYDSFFEAQKIVNLAGKIGRSKHRKCAKKRPKRVYKCEICGKYHLTSKLTKFN